MKKKRGLFPKFQLIPILRFQVMHDYQWRNMQGGVPPIDFWPENFCWPTGKKGARKKGKRGEIEKKREIAKGKVENGKWKVEKLQNEERSFFFFFFFSFFASHFSKPLKFVLSLPKWKFSTGKKHFTPGKNSGKMTLPPQKKFPVTPLMIMCVSLLP